MAAFGCWEKASPTVHIFMSDNCISFKRKLHANGKDIFCFSGLFTRVLQASYLTYVADALYTAVYKKEWSQQLSGTLLMFLDHFNFYPEKKVLLLDFGHFGGLVLA